MSGVSIVRLEGFEQSSRACPWLVRHREVPQNGSISKRRSDNTQARCHCIQVHSVSAGALIIDSVGNKAHRTVILNWPSFYSKIFEMDSSCLLGLEWQRRGNGARTSWSRVKVAKMMTSSPKRFLNTHCIAASQTQTRRSFLSNLHSEYLWQILRNPSLSSNLTSSGTNEGLNT